MGDSSSDGSVWWPSLKVVNWVCGLDPTLTVEKVLDGLEDRCACGRVRAHGRFHVYSTNRSIKLNAEDVELYSRNYSRVRGAIGEADMSLPVKSGPSKA
jgi:hypothetical protein